jgi:hypothetical protein
LKIELSHYNDSKMSDKGWGSDFVDLTFGPIMIFDLPCNLSVILGVNWANGKSYTSDSVENCDFRKQQYEDWFVSFDSIYMSIGWIF